ncbi:MAG: ZIP family metal transporter, partial [Chloroflexi bacterium]|nr:ZIP family metal transporter [Chloroflexota bacterium]
MVWLYAIGSVIVVSLIALAGILFLSVDRARLDRMLLLLISFAVGALAGDAFIHLIPETFKELGLGLRAPLLIIGGLMLFFVLEQSIRWRHCYLPIADHHVHPVGTLNLTGEAMHNFIDGVLIAASYTVSIPIGIATTVAVILHEIPQEIGDFAVLVYAGFPVRRALLYNFLVALTAIAGVIIVLLLGSLIEGLSIIVLPITAGGFIYMALSDLIPEIQQHCEKLLALAEHSAAVLLGIGLM